MYSYGPPHMAKQKQDNQLEQTYSSYVRIRDVALKTWFGLVWFGGFYGISTFVGYLTPNLFLLK